MRNGSSITGVYARSDFGVSGVIKVGFTTDEATAKQSVHVEPGLITGNNPNVLIGSNEQTIGTDLSTGF
jgi:hypothetical protein